MLIDSRSPSHMFAATQKGAFRSLDGGTSWQAIRRGFADPALPVTQIALDAADGRTLYALSDGLYRSSNGGDSWARVRREWPGQPGGRLAVLNGTLYIGTQVLGVFVSRNGGRGFANALRGQDVHGFTPIPSGLLAGTSAGLVRTQDDGRSWKPFQRGLRARSLRDLVIDPGDPAHWFVLDLLPRVLRSEDGGRTWIAVANYARLVDPTALAIDSLDSRIWVGGVNGLELSEDGGQSWQARSGLGAFWPTLILPDSSRGRIYISGLSLEIFDRCSGLRSVDDGLTFACAELPNDGVYVALRPDGSDLFATSPAGLHRSTDGGDSWTLWSPNVRPQKLVFAPHDPLLMYAIGGEGGSDVLRSEDGGRSWSGPQGGAVHISDIVLDSSDSAKLYAASYVGAYESDDGARTWHLLSPSGEVTLDRLALDPSMPDFLYATSSGGGLLRLLLTQ